MRSLELKPHLSDEALIEKLSASRNTLAFSRWQLLYLIQVAGQRTSAVIAPVVGLSRPSIYKIVQRYNRLGPGAVSCAKRGGRRNAFLSTDQEQHLFASLEQQASKGLIKTAGDLRQVVEAKVGKAVSDDFLWDLLARNGWTKKKPRPHHPKRDVAVQNEFKKNFLKSWTF